MPWAPRLQTGAAGFGKVKKTRVRPAHDEPKGGCNGALSPLPKLHHLGRDRMRKRPYPNAPSHHHQRYVSGRMVTNEIAETVNVIFVPSAKLTPPMRSPASMGEAW